MRLITNDEINRVRINDSFNRICNNCSGDLCKIIQKMPLLVTDDLNAQEIYSDQYDIFQKAYSGGFGGMKGNIFYENNKWHLVVLNITQINNFKLTDEEFDGIFSHELGHIFNENPVREFPSVLKGNTKIEIDEAKKLKMKESETYADYFSKLTNTCIGLVSSINKYLALPNCLNAELFIERLEQLKNEDSLVGEVKVIS